MTTAKKISKKTKKKKQNLSPQDKKLESEKKNHRRSVRIVLSSLGARRVTSLTDKQIEFENRKGDFDDIFVLENLILFFEYTSSKSSSVKDHVIGKKILFDNIQNNHKDFVKYLRSYSDDFNNTLGNNYHDDDLIVKIIYCSRFDFDQTIKSNFSNVVFFDYPIVKYFELLASTIRRSARFEFYEFLSVDPMKVGENGVVGMQSSVTYHALMLPEKSSGLPANYKVVSFYASPDALLRRAYVLRRDGWRSSFQAYQRMIRRGKIDEIRRKLKSNKRVFFNNLVATLPSDVHAVDENGKTIEFESLTKTEMVTIDIPLRPNSIGLIDGQHRLYSYFESKKDDEEIAKLRLQQNLLITGVIYPDGLDTRARERFEASLFLSINSNQTNAPTSLRQEIAVLLDPSSPIAIGKQVMQGLSKDGPLAGHVEAYFFEKGKLKTTSIVSYGLGPLIKLSGDDSLFKRFSHPEKDKIASGQSDAALEAYLKFSCTEINKLLGAVRHHVGADRWTTSKDIKNRVVTVTVINSILITLRHLTAASSNSGIEFYKENLRGIEDFPFSDFHSSQYGRMAQEICNRYFPETVSRGIDS